MILWHALPDYFAGPREMGILMAVTPKQGQQIIAGFTKLEHKGILQQTTDQDNLLHNINGPARVWTDGDKEWFVHGERHRLDGPAVEWSNGARAWIVHGKLHRTDGPALIRGDGTQEWYFDGQVHRLLGPAVIHLNGKVEWWYKGLHITPEEYWNEMYKRELITKQDLFLKLL